jgi:hypothetical protein
MALSLRSTRHATKLAKVSPEPNSDTWFGMFN